MSPDISVPWGSKLSLVYSHGSSGNSNPYSYESFGLCFSSKCQNERGSIAVFIYPFTKYFLNASHRPGTKRCMLTMYWKGKANTGFSSWKTVQPSAGKFEDRGEGFRRSRAGGGRPRLVRLGALNGAVLVVPVRMAHTRAQRCCRFGSRPPPSAEYRNIAHCNLFAVRGPGLHL